MIFRLFYYSHVFDRNVCMQQNEGQMFKSKYSEISLLVNSQVVTNLMEGLLSVCSVYAVQEDAHRYFLIDAALSPRGREFPKHRFPNLTHLD